MYQPIRRNTLCLPKNKGGLGIINVYDKATSILSCTCLKAILNNIGFSHFYTKIRLSHMIKTSNIQEVSFTSPLPYTVAINTIRQMYHHQNFPNLRSKHVYLNIFQKCTPAIEENYPLFNWKRIWERINNPFIGINEREFLFKYMHETLATNQRLEMLKIRDNGKCNKCGEAEYSLHIFYFCRDIGIIVKWFQDTFGK